MTKDIIFQNRKRLVFVAEALVFLLFVYLCFTIVIHVQTKNDDRAVEEALTGITYTENVAQSEIQSLLPYMEIKYLSVEQRGQLYRSLAELSYMTGDDMEYNHYMAYALFYLQRAGDTNAVVYLTNKYVGRFYANGCYASAEDILEKMATDNDIACFASEEQASYYLSYADVAQMQDKEASSYLKMAEEAIHKMPENGKRQLSQAKYDLLCARNDIQNGDFEQAEKRMEAYTAADHFGLGADQVYVLCDFKIPYYEIETKIELHNGNESAVSQNAEQYIELCDRFQFRAMKLRLLQYIVSHEQGSMAKTVEKYEELEESVFIQNLEEMTNEYGHFLVSDILNTHEELKISEQKQAATKRLLPLGLIFCGVAVALNCAVTIFIDYMNKDGLTQLNSRRQYEKICRICAKKEIPYCLLVIDIDDFKKVNDTYGHAKGDEVLREISGILNRYTGRGISAYRYGGEEMCLIFLRISEQRVRQIAEEIRRRIETEVQAGHQNVTVSGGIGISKAGEDAFQQADSCLYESKKNGKNQIR